MPPSFWLLQVGFLHACCGSWQGYALPALSPLFHPVLRDFMRLRQISSWSFSMKHTTIWWAELFTFQSSLTRSPILNISRALHYVVTMVKSVTILDSKICFVGLQRISVSEKILILNLKLCGVSMVQRYFPMRAYQSCPKFRSTHRVQIRESWSIFPRVSVLVLILCRLRMQQVLFSSSENDRMSNANEDSHTKGKAKYLIATWRAYRNHTANRRSEIIPASVFTIRLPQKALREI